jgi:hypothetical protein
MTVAGNEALTDLDTHPTSTDRARRHRERLRAEGCRRLDVTIGSDVVGKLKAVAKKLEVPVWQAAEEAFEDLATKHGV